MNLVSIVGRVTKDIELRETNAGKKVTHFTLAVNRRGEGTDFIPCIAWEKTAETLAKYITKGRQIGVVGRLVSGSYEKDGRKVSTLDVNVTEFDFCDSKEQKPAAVNRTERRRQEEAKVDRFVDIPDTIDEELPFN